MIAHYHGGVWNAADPARSLGVSEPTVRRYLDLFTGLFLVRQLPAWHENLGKRQVKAPKVYIRDSGLLHGLLGLATSRELLSHPKAGASWEEELLHAVRPESAMRVALDDLKLARLMVLYPGPRRYALADRVVVVPAVELASGRPAAVIAGPKPSTRRRGSTPA